MLGATWRADLDCRAYGPGLAILDIRSAPSEGHLTPSGEILVGGALLQRTIVPSSALTSRFSWDLPLDMALLGLTLHAQGLCRASQTGPLGPKTRQARSRLSNALDLELGF